MDFSDWGGWLTVAIAGFTALTVLGAVVIGIVFSIAPVAVIVWWFMSRSKKAKAAQASALSWRETKGKILKSRVEVSGNDYVRVKACIVYEYQVAGKTYQNDQIKPGDRYIGVSNSSEQYDLVEKYPAGAEVTLLYNPQNPAESALER